MNMKDKYLNKSTVDDEFYTMYDDIESEMSYYNPDVFRGKIVYCCCDSTRSNFFKYFFIKFKSLGLKGLMQTCLDEDNTSYVSTMKYYDGVSIKDTSYYGIGDFRETKIQDFMLDADIIITNPPFSIFRDFIDILCRLNRDFIVLGSSLSSANSYIYDLVVNNSLYIQTNNNMLSPEMHFSKPDLSIKEVGCVWYSTIKSNKRDKTLGYVDKTKSSYDVVTNIDGIDVININSVNDIPKICDCYMAVPVAVLWGYDLSKFTLYSGIEIGKRLKLHGKILFSMVILRYK